MEDNGINFMNCGKYIIASSKDEIPEIERLHANGIKNGVPGIRIAEGSEIEGREPQVRAIAGVHVPTAGIMNSFELMKRLETLAKDSGALFAYRTGASRIEKNDNGK